MCLPTLRLIALASMIMLASPGLDAHAGNAPTPVTAELGTTAGEIDKGLPVIGYPRRDELDCGYAYGYEGAGEDRKFLWRSYHTGEKHKNWRENWTSEVRKREQEILANALELETQAIAELEKVLASIGADAMDSDTTQNKAVVLDNVKPIFEGLFERWGAGEGSPWAERSDTYMYLTCMLAAGWDADYADMITISGYGPSFGYSQEKWWAHYFPPPGRDKRIGEATGFGFRWEQRKTPEEYWQGLKKTIDDHKPVYGPYTEGVLFIGYRDAERPEDRQVRPIAAVFVEPGAWWSWQQFVDWHANHSDGGWFGCHIGEVDMLPPKDSAVDVLRTMVQMATDDPRGGNPMFEGVTWGLAGIVAYADDLADLSKSGAKQEYGGYFQGGWRGCHNIYPQMSGRPAAASYLRRIAPLFDGEAKSHILAAADQYVEATEAWREFEKQLGRPLGELHGQAWACESGLFRVTQSVESIRANSSPMQRSFTSFPLSCACNGRIWYTAVLI